VTEFCRDATVFQELENNILPVLLGKKDYVNIWSAGCSNGAEVYSIAMLLCENRKKVNYRILGTDMDELSLARAAAGGPYRDDLIKNVPKHLVSKYFTLDNGDYWVKKEIREKAHFKRHNLLADKFETGFDLIACRNVTIYFTEEAKEKLNQRFFESLREDGVLFVGATEFMIDATKLGFGKFGSCFYQKKNSASLAKV
jgi:chemotaxis protein methyltransferase CheR